MKAAEIRSRFINYFKKNGHAVVESSSLVPQNDPTLLFTNAGMVQFKDVFLGKEKRPYTRATTSQKCVRAGGKHNDLENVGFTARHHTFFEMLGNFSFGDYFKKEAIHFAWEFITQELKLPTSQLYVTVFEKDDEAADIWHLQEKIPRDRIYRFGEKDNFWAMGDVGPCGPCSEIFIDRGEKYGCGKPTCGMGCDCDRFMEFWNLVFMQYERSADGKLAALPKPSVDTGAGLERLASILQNCDSNYETDVFSEVIQKTASLLGKPYRSDDPNKVSFRVIADHARSTTFLIGDGILPSNEGRGYVLRRIMRRAIRHGKKLGFAGPFLHQIVGHVVRQMQDAFPDLASKRAFIEKAVFAEEEQFLKTLEKGLALLDDETAKLGQTKVLSGEMAFKLYDTYGFPLDLTRVICFEKGLSVDEQGFERSMDRQRSESRKNWKGSGEQAINEAYKKLAGELASRSKMPRFVGYETHRHTAECVGILVPNEASFTSTSRYDVRKEASAESPEKDELIEAVFLETPFYGESGGQVGDHGRISGEGFEAEVINVQKPMADLIVAHLRPIRGSLVVGKSYLQETDGELRSLTARNHTATHLLHWALRRVLGNHVKQAGSLVAPDLLRFDFTHFQPMTSDELLTVENLINEKIWSAHPVSHKEMGKDEATALGAIAFFGEKYGERVRVIQVGEFSTELCGGTHVNNSSDIHLFKIGNESGIASGVRRILAYTSKGAFEYLRSREKDLLEVRDRLKVSSADEIQGKLERLIATEKELRNRIGQLEAQSANEEVESILARSSKLGDVTTIISRCEPHVQGMKRVRELVDRLKEKSKKSVIVIGMPEESKVHLLVAVDAALGKTAPANQLLQHLCPYLDAKGGGKPELAQAGGSKPSGLDQALSEASRWLTEKLRGVTPPS